MKKADFQILPTEVGGTLPAVPWNEYPRPRLRRAEWLCLNGEWDLSTEDGDGKITVPFCPESLLSGFKGRIQYGKKLLYKRKFTVPDGWLYKRIIIHFGAVSRSCRVYINGKETCRHENAYLPFSADVTDAIKDGENELTVEAVNDLSPRYPYGKQRIKRGGMWYTPVSGIWQTVWLEPVPERHIADVRVTPDLCGADIVIEGVASGTVVFEGKEYRIENGRTRLEPDSPILWSPETPHLYDFTVKSGEDEAASYFALRTLSVGRVGGVPRLCLNGRPSFFHGLLDQGYYSDGISTPASPELYEKDIKTAKSLGFNMLRKHIKIEPERFYYECDRLGIVVFQDMVNNGKYRFLHDTILPTLGIRKLSDKKLNRGEETRTEFLSSMESTVKHLYSHPCICGWTIFNEGWGQFDADAAYEKLRALDGSRFIDSTSGWFHQSKSDVESLHIYFGKLKLTKGGERPQILSEFGGYVYKDLSHSFNTKKTYGYRIYGSRGEMVAALRKTYTEKIVPLAVEGLCASVYTQLSDVEDETNGVMTYDREICKILPDELSDVARMLQDAVTST